MIIAIISHATFQSLNAFLKDAQIITIGFCFTDLSFPPLITSFVDLKQIKKHGIAATENTSAV